MGGWTFALGRIFGVEIRLHAFFVILLLPSAFWAAAEGRPIVRGLVLWALLLAAVLLRELARAIAAACFGLDLQRVILLASGGLQMYGSADTEARANAPGVRRTMALVGPISSVALALMLAGLILTAAPDVSLMAQPWISPAHLVRALVWIPLMLGVLNLLPAWPLDGVGLVPGAPVQGTPSPATAMGRLRSIRSLGFGVGVALVVSGLLSANWWVVMFGIFLLLGTQAQRQGLLPAADAQGTRVGEVMLTDYSVLPASATLEDAMVYARHSLQDVFPVVRGGVMVGAVGRQNIVEALASGGNGYIQGIMARSFHTATEQDSLLETLNRAMGQSKGQIGSQTAGSGSGQTGGSLELVPVVEGDVIVGILTPQHLHRSLGILPRRVLPAGDGTER